MTELWRKLILTYAETSIDAPALKVVTLAQWALESGHGASSLAKDHFNFAGMKFRARINQGRENQPLAVPVDYLAHDGEDTYCKFASLSDFIAGYWAFVDNGPMYDGWLSYASDPSGYIGHLFRGGYAGDPNYIDKVLALVPTIRQQIDDLGLTEAFMESNAPALARVAILIGHNVHAKGAYSELLTVSEWDYNSRVADAMKISSPEFGLEPRVFFREKHPRGYSAEIAAAYAAVDAWEPAVILELHFNAGGGSGTEILYWHTSSQGKNLPMPSGLPS